MVLARFSPDADNDLPPQDVEVVQPVANVPTGDAFVVRGLLYGGSFLAWADELTFVANPAEVVRA